MTFIKVNNTDKTWETLKKGFNLRWPDNKENSAGVIYVCHSVDDILLAAQDARKNNYRITIRSGGHCYEGFVSNKDFPGNTAPTEPLAIIDMNLSTGLEYSAEGQISSEFDTTYTGYKFKASAGNQNWDGYVGLYKTTGKTVPGGSCYSVGAGGHVTGGGYGLLSRRHGLVVDWLAGIDVITPDGKGGFSKRHVSNTSTKDEDKDLFSALCGAGGGNFGIITNYYYKELPDAPQTAALVRLSLPWSDIGNAAALGKFLQAYYAWFNTNDPNWNSTDAKLCNGGLFSLLKLQHKNTGNIELVIQYTGSDGTYTPDVNDQPLQNFIQAMNAASGNKLRLVQSTTLTSVRGALKQCDDISVPVSASTITTRKMDWLYLTQTINGSGENQYGKYKSAYQNGQFTSTVTSALYTFLTTSNPKLNQALVQIDSYGGCINDTSSHSNKLTSVSQRNSLLKWQFQVYWQDVSDETECVKWIRDIYSGCFKDYNGKPWSTYNQKDTPFDGCYINYPDIDMKYAADNETVDKDWMKLYYGDVLPGKLISVKKAVDPQNIFRHELSIPLSNS